MRKRRRLANKMTIMVCAVLLAVSAFFYAPMENVYASSESINSDSFSYSFSHNVDLDLVYGPYYYARFLYDFKLPDNLLNDIVDDTYYYLEFDYLLDLFYDYYSYFYCENSFVSSLSSGAYLFNIPSKNGIRSLSWDNSSKVVLRGSDLKSTFQFNILTLSPSRVENLNIDLDFVFDLVSCVPLTGEESASYQQGYNAGYSAGEEVGESNGYSSGYSDGFTEGEQSGYNSGFQAGSDSVDTQSYYDMGYSAGYDAGYSSGYDTGYDEGYDAGWSAYEAQMDKWGADTSDYPILLHNFSVDDISRLCLVAGSKSISEMIPIQPDDLVLHYGISLPSDFVFNPFHVYKFVLDFDDLFLQRDLSYVYYDDILMNLNVGGYSYPLSGSSDAYELFYIPGDRISNSLDIIWTCFNAYTEGSSNGQIGFKFSHLDLKVFDMGPSGDTQNHIANQTDQLTNGYDDSKGNQVNLDLSTGLNEYETAENSLFATATTGLNDFTFFDFESVPAMITGMSFIGSIMGSWFNQAGGASGVGIVLSILFSVILVAMVLGLYRWYQSRGGKN